MENTKLYNDYAKKRSQLLQTIDDDERKEQTRFAVYEQLVALERAAGIESPAIPEDIYNLPPEAEASRMYLKMGFDDESLILKRALDGWLMALGEK